MKSAVLTSITCVPGIAETSPVVAVAKALQHVDETLQTQAVWVPHQTQAILWYLFGFHRIARTPGLCLELCFQLKSVAKTYRTRIHLQANNDTYAKPVFAPATD